MIDKIYIKDKEVQRITINDGLYYENKPWYFQYGVEADYVISNGIDNWIDTYIGTQPDLIIEMGVTYLKSGKEQSAFGAYDLNKVVIEAGSFTSGNDSFYAYDDDRTWDVTGFDVEMNKHYNLKYNFQNGLQIMYVDDVEVHRTTNTSGALVGLTMVLFCRNYGTASSNTRQNHMNAKWTYFKVSKSDGTILADYKPFYISKKPMTDWKEREHQVGKYIMIDMVRESATPLYGADMEGSHTPWWEEYGVRAEYLKSDGTAYIDTNYVLQYDNGTTEIAVSVENITTSPSIYGFIERSGDISNRIAAGSTSSGLFVGAGNTVYLVDSTIENQKYNIVWNRKTSKALLDGVEINTLPGKTSGNTYPAYLFSRNDKGKPDADGIYNLIGNIYYLKEILDDVVQFSYIPIQITKQFTDLRGVTHNVGSYIMVNELIKNDVPTHYGTFTGAINENWWKEYGVLAEYIENINNESYIITDVTPVPNKLSLNTECVFLNDITSAPFGCRPTENASTSSNNIFQVNNTIRIDLLGDASLSIPKENNIVYNIDYNGVDNVFTINGSKYNGSLEKSSTKVTHPFAIFANNSGGVLSVGSACIMRYNKFNINDKQYIPIQVTKEFIDLKGITHSIGDYIMVNRVSYKDVPTHIGEFNGNISQELMWFETTPSSTGIRTNFIPTNVTAPLTKIELMCSFTSGSSGYLVNGIGGGPTLYVGMNPSSKLAYGNLATDSSISYNLNYDTYYKLTVDYKNKTISVDDEVVASNISLFSFNRDDRNFGLNCYVNTVTNNIFNDWGQKTQYCKIYVDDVLTHHWVGKLNNNKVDVYDKIEEVFLGDLGLIEGQENLISGDSICGYYLTYDSDTALPYTNIGTWNTISKIEYDFSSTDTSNSDVFLGYNYINGYVGYVGSDEFFVKEQAQPTIVSPNITRFEKGDGNRRIITFEIGSTNTQPVSVGAYSDTRYSKAKKIYGFKVWDKEGNLVIDAEPREYESGGNFYNKITDEFLPIIGEAYIFGQD